jgi:hypothetical protein
MVDRWFDWTFRNPNGHVVIWQAPNLPLWIWIICAIFELPLRGLPQSVLAMIGTAALGIWGVQEAKSGDSRFRRLLGVAGLVLVLCRIIVWLWRP